MLCPPALYPAFLVQSGRIAIIGSTMADNDKLYKSEGVGSGTFIISKPKRKPKKLRQSRVKKPRRGARK